MGRGAAWALAHAGADRTSLSPGEDKMALADLPITSLRLDAGTELIAEIPATDAAERLHPGMRAAVAIATESVFIAP